MSTDSPHFESKFAGLDTAKALEVYLEKGPTAEAATILGVSQDLFRTWTLSPEGRRAIDLARSSLNALLDLGLTNIINQASARVLAVLENGQEVMDRHGDLRNVKVSGKEAANILALVFDRRQLLRKQPTQIGGELDEKLEELAQKLRYLGGVSPPGPRDTDGPDTPAYLPLHGPSTGDPFPMDRYTVSTAVPSEGELVDSRYSSSSTDEGN